MQIALFLTVLVLAVVLHASADLFNNQIDDNRPRVRFGRPYSVKSCRECSSGECQVMGMQRFSEPRCEPLGGLGSPCRMWQEPENKTLHFPSTILNCNDVYMQFCPCAPGLVCEEAECRRTVLERIKFAPTNWARGRVSRASLSGTEVDDDGDEEMPVALEPTTQSGYRWAVAKFR